MARRSRSRPGRVGADGPGACAILSYLWLGPSPRHLKYVSQTPNVDSMGHGVCEKVPTNQRRVVLTSDQNQGFAPKPRQPAPPCLNSLPPLARTESSASEICLSDTTCRPYALMVGVILFKKICTRPPCRQGPVPAGGIAHHRAERGRDVGRAPGLSSHQNAVTNALCRVSCVRAA